MTYLTAAAVYARVSDFDGALSTGARRAPWRSTCNESIDSTGPHIRRLQELTRAGYCADAEEIIEQDGFQHVLAGESAIRRVSRCSR